MKKPIKPKSPPEFRPGGDLYNPAPGSPAYKFLAEKYPDLLKRK